MNQISNTLDLNHGWPAQPWFLFYMRSLYIKLLIFPLTFNFPVGILIG